jgi:hypothetical protein
MPAAATATVDGRSACFDNGLIDRNPAKGKRRRLKASKLAPVWLDSAEQPAVVAAKRQRGGFGGFAAV